MVVGLTDVDTEDGSVIDSMPFPREEHEAEEHAKEGEEEEHAKERVIEAGEPVLRAR